MNKLFRIMSLSISIFTILSYNLYKADKDKSNFEKLIKALQESNKVCIFSNK